ncbi:MAG TPA: AMP-binding protein, partial [Thermoplasmata archaeon]|nr:AMP-binding protein [Thermoplasmata archaeon]
MRPTIRPADGESWGVPRKPAKALAARIEAASQRHAGSLDARAQERFWLELRALLLANPETRWRFAAHLALYRLAYDGREPRDGPGPAWMPSKAGVQSSNIGKLMAARRLRSFADLQRWSIDRREEFWSTMIRKLGIAFRKEPTRILKQPLDLRHPEWLPGARMNIAESCFRAGPNKTAILSGLEGSDSIRKMTYGELRRLSARVANGLEELGLDRGEKIALFLPMTPEAVAAYLGIVLSGRCVVGIADAAAPPEFRKRVRIAGARAVITVDTYLRDGKEHAIYSKVVDGNGPRAIVIPRAGPKTHFLRDGDIAWKDFLSDRDAYEAVSCRACDHTNILFSSGTTKDPKAIPWTHTTPIKSAADAYLHQDIRPRDVLAWPTSFGWMMGPWLTYGSFVNEATMALYVGATTAR